MDDASRRRVVVIGSGFGGSVAACRLAQAGIDVVVLERGRWYRNDFPRRVGEEFLWRGDSRGPFDVDSYDGVTVVRAAGVGGGSLLYSNVHLALPADAFGAWPADWSRAALDPYYDLVAHMIGLTPIKDGLEYWPLPNRTRLLKDASEDLGAGRSFFYPPLAVDFGDPVEWRDNDYGVPQRGCRHCGKCSVGCNHGAKNSLDKNYLPHAVACGAQIRAECEVMRLRAVPDGGYRVEFRNHVDEVDEAVEAGTVVLAAGAVGTTALLLEHRADLGDLSGRLGERYSANGDVVTVAAFIDQAWEPTVGPAITAGVLAVDEHWFLVQDGGVPPVSLLDLGIRPDDRDPDYPVEDVEWIVAEKSAILLGMGRDAGSGRLIPGKDGVEIDWSYDANEAYYDDVADYQNDLGRALAQRAGLNAGPLTRRAVTVHSLGGAVMAEDREHGVVSPTGEVFGAPGLFVMDGAAIPAATGVNPSHTIAAVAERNVERLIRKIKDPGWLAPERANAPHHHDPLPSS